jgi:hypothetical protein
MRKPTNLTPLKLIGLAVVGLAVLIQFVPYGRNHQNPTVVREPTWSSHETRTLAVHACFDCHSNESVWPWYSSIAPVSWLVQRDVEEGRSKLNFSEWNSTQEPGDAAETISNGTMPPIYYVWLHPRATLSETEKQALIDGLGAMGSTGYQKQLTTGELEAARQARNTR